MLSKLLKAWGDKAEHIKLIRRPERTGYKAGALKYGLEITEGEFIAVFDADFLPKSDFLYKTIPHFLENEKVGVVQTRWEHINKDYSILTKIQAFGLDAHFTVEQVGRNVKNHFINFNGTAGIWRKSCIEDAGNWQADTLTEDLDLSYRAQLKGWEFVYKENLGCPSELPATMNALKSQQHRWNKGAAENVRKNLGKVLRSGMSLSSKFYATFHLLNSTVFISVLLLALMSVPLLFIKQVYGEEYKELFKYASSFILSFLILFVFYGIAFKRVHKEEKVSFIKFIRTFPVFLSLSMGLSLHNALAVIEGYRGKKSAFVRTPKFNILSKKDKWVKNKYRIKKVNKLTFVEILLFFYFLLGLGVGIHLNDYGLFFLHIMLAFGFGTVSFYSLKHANA